MISIPDDIRSADVTASCEKITDQDEDTGLRHVRSYQRGGNNINIRKIFEGRC
jgi:hypothetical protein